MAVPEKKMSEFEERAASTITSEAEMHLVAVDKSDDPVVEALISVGDLPSIKASGYRVSSDAIIADATTSRTLAAGDNGKTVVFSSGSAITVTVPAGLGAGFSCSIIQAGAGQVTFTADGTTINSFGGFLKTAGQHAAASLLATASNVFNLAGALSA